MDGKLGQGRVPRSARALRHDLAKLESEMNAYLDWVIRKMAKGQFRDQKLVRWNEVDAAESRPAGSEDDDRLEMK